jgi:hypothetical protein
MKLGWAANGFPLQNINSSCSLDTQPCLTPKNSVSPPHLVLNPGLCWPNVAFVHSPTFMSLCLNCWLVIRLSVWRAGSRWKTNTIAGLWG